MRRSFLVALLIALPACGGNGSSTSRPTVCHVRVVAPPVDGQESLIVAFDVRSADDVLAVDTGGRIFRKGANGWRLKKASLPVDATSVDRQNQLWAAGVTERNEPAVARWTPQGWARLPTDGLEDLEFRAIAAVDDRDVWLLSSLGLSGSERLAHWNGVGWDVQALRGHDVLSDEAGIAAVGDELWVVRDSGRVDVRAPDGTWKTVSLPIRPPATVRSLLVRSQQDVWVLGQTIPFPRGDLLTLHWNGRHWRRVRSPRMGEGSTFRAAGGAPRRTSSWVAGSGGASGSPFVERWDGQRWRILPRPAESSVDEISAIGVVDPNEAWLAGRVYAANGLLLKFEHYICH